MLALRLPIFQAAKADENRQPVQRVDAPVSQRDDLIRRKDWKGRSKSALWLLPIQHSAPADVDAKNI